MPRQTFVLLTVVGVVGVPVAVGAGTAKPQAAAVVAMSVQGVWQQGASYVVVLRAPATGIAARLLPIWIGGREAQAIQMGLNNTRPPRPLTHDLLQSVIAQLGATVERVEVTQLKQSVFIGQLALRDAAGKRHLIDARPSDLIALAVGRKLPVHVAQAVLDRAGRKHFPTPSPNAPLPSPAPQLRPKKGTGI